VTSLRSLVAPTPITLALLLGCGAEAPGAQDVAVRFVAQVHGAPFRCGQSYADMGKNRGSFTPRDLRMFVHELALLDARGERVPLELDQDGAFQLDDLALLDFEGEATGCDEGTPETHVELRGRVPEGRYRGLTFKLGVPFAHNHGDQALAPSPLNLTSMFWTWRDGYKFLRFEGEADGTGFIFHVGSTGCDGDFAGGTTRCSAANVASIMLPDYQPGQTVVLDLGALLAGSDLASLSATEVGCMSGPDETECAPLFERLGLPFGARPATEQQVFHAE
jgi:uncharacterized repeat protein (TIGR04052 family)